MRILSDKIELTEMLMVWVDFVNKLTAYCLSEGLMNNQKD
jgi:hypothetical protein